MFENRNETKILFQLAENRSSEVFKKGVFARTNDFHISARWFVRLRLQSGRPQVTPSKGVFITIRASNPNVETRNPKPIQIPKIRILPNTP